ncbi:MAG: radical SAM protein, partial [Candidatus Omnitrophica bacterium]|nr:radical SAM protein [Candidatus Omnitrophota bacterium]
SAHDKTLKSINRGHTFNDFLNAVKLTGEFDIPICVHVILGLPGETKEDMMATAMKLAELNIKGIKIHLLHILKGSKLEELYRKGDIILLKEDEYAELACEFLHNLSPDIIVQRLTGQGSKDDHIAPLWALDKTGTIDKITKAISSSRL